MEAKVDVRKLQLLNDRIAQTIEALNQVRLSVHGLSHTNVMQSAMPFGQTNMPFTQGNFPFTPQNIPYPGYGMMPPTYPGYQGFFPGLSHSPFTAPYTMGNVPGFIPPFPIQGFTPPFPTPNFPGFTPLPFMSGLSHTSPEIYEQRILELKASDPYRLVQTFPFMNTPSWPNVW